MIQQNETSTLLDKADAKTLIAQATPGGSWQQSGSSPIAPIHAALLRTGKILLIGGSATDKRIFEQTCPSPNTTTNNCPSDPNDNTTCPGWALNNSVAVWNVNNGTFSRPTIPVDSVGKPIDLFCVGHSFRSDGRLMAAGGTGGYGPYRGIKAAFLFNPNNDQWQNAAQMNYARWYPTVVTLGNGRIFALSGITGDGFGLVLNPEIYNGSSGWTAFSQQTASAFPMYSQLFLLSSGKLFFSGASFNEDANNVVTPRILTLPSQFTQAIAEQAVPGLASPEQRNQAASVLLPPAQDQKVMILGGGTFETFGGQATNTVFIVDLKAANPTYQAGPSLNNPRMHANAVILPDRTVFVCNGSKVGEDQNQSQLPAEIYNPANNTWTQVAAQTVPHVYHAWALLLPDGRVAAGGGTPGLACNELRLEIYSPAYISQTRPVIQQAPSSVSYGGTFTIQTPQAQNIKWVNLIRPSATTHSCDPEQRLVDVQINSRTSTSLSVTVTNNRNIAPPGYYMLFLTNNNNVPSVARWIRLT